MDAFSSRRQTITEQARQVAAEREAQTGRRPDARQMYRIQKDIAYRTRAAKPEMPLDLRASCASGSRRRGNTTWANWPPSTAVTQAARRRAPAASRKRGRTEQTGRSSAAGGADDRVGARPSVRPRPRRGRVPAHPAVRPLHHPQRHRTPGRWIRRGSWTGGRRKRAPTRSRSGRSGARPPAAQARSGPPPGPRAAAGAGGGVPGTAGRADRGSGAGT